MKKKQPIKRLDPRICSVDIVYERLKAFWFNNTGKYNSFRVYMCGLCGWSNDKTDVDTAERQLVQHGFAQHYEIVSVDDTPPPSTVAMNMNKAVASAVQIYDQEDVEGTEPPKPTEAMIEAAEQAAFERWLKS